MSEIFKGSLLEEVANFTGEHEKILPCTKCKPMKNLVNLGPMTELEIVLYTLAKRREIQGVSLVKSLCGVDLRTMKSTSEANYAYMFTLKKGNKAQLTELKKLFREEDFFSDLMRRIIQNRFEELYPNSYLHLHPGWTIMKVEFEESEDDNGSEGYYAKRFMSSIIGEA